ncbi:phosphatidylinositol-glycan biosynthesis class F protein-like [Penaeus monodon]|uniref:phosphatidylinositol-glycan biosynthesis class F protein-like n=1 Tax=Penaeus monodon TaxID=6687 RepID=UPI0018A79DB3|nr:phosphatidylinositol-glycan biosynthesis class F protein-like [Penaeus monodon]XP_037803348.1 phosphatidylinositol-glycan biosynthesis class F protein-like [Penaeus monodon]
MVALAARDQPLPILLTCKYLLSLVLGLGLLLTLVQSEFELQACLRALRIYSLVVVVLQVALQFVVPEASALHPGGGGSGEGHITAGFGKGKARNKAGKLVDFFLVVILSIFSVCLTHIVTVLYGAYLIENIEETFTFSILVASLAFVRPLVTLGPGALGVIIERASFEEEPVLQSLTAVVGAWFGALPIPLDWDTPWQVWPLTCCIGAVIGEVGASAYLLSKIYKVVDSRKKNKST